MRIASYGDVAGIEFRVVEAKGRCSPTPIEVCGMLKRKFGSWPVLLVCFAMLAIGAGCDGEEGNESPGGSGGGVAGSGVGGSGGEEPGQGGSGGEEPGQGGSGGEEPGQGGSGGEEPGQGGTGGEEPGQGGTGGEEPGQGGTGGEEPGQGGTGGEEPGQGGTGGEEPGQGGTGGEEPGQGGTGGEEPGQGGTGGEEPGQGGTGGEEPGVGGTGVEEPGQGGTGGEEPGQGGTGGEEPGQGGTGGEIVVGPRGATEAQCEQTCARLIEGCGSTRFGDRFECESWCFGNFSGDEAECLTGSQCTGMELEACFGTDATNDCEAMCEHVYGCGVNFDGQNITYCDGLCAAGEFTNDELNCILGSTCEMSEMEACMPGEGGPEGTCYDMCDYVYGCEWHFGVPLWECYDICDFDGFSEEEVACTLNVGACGNDAFNEVAVCFASEAVCEDVFDDSPECEACIDEAFDMCLAPTGACGWTWDDFALCSAAAGCTTTECGIENCPDDWWWIDFCVQFACDEYWACFP